MRTALCPWALCHYPPPPVELKVDNHFWINDGLAWSRRRFAFCLRIRNPRAYGRRAEEPFRHAGLLGALGGRISWRESSSSRGPFAIFARRGGILPYLCALYQVFTLGSLCSFARLGLSLRNEWVLLQTARRYARFLCLFYKSGPRQHHGRRYGLTPRG